MSSYYPTFPEFWKAVRQVEAQMNNRQYQYLEICCEQGSTDPVEPMMELSFRPSVRAFYVLRAQVWRSAGAVEIRWLTTWPIVLSHPSGRVQLKTGARVILRPLWRGDRFRSRGPGSFRW